MEKSSFDIPLSDIIDEDLKASADRGRYFIVLSDISRCKNLPNFLSYFANQGATYYYIVHDKDDSGFVHAHLILNLPHSIKYKTMINLMCQLTETNDENVQLSGIKNFVLAVQYLLHLNEIDKYHYDKSELLTNDDEIDDILAEIVCKKKQLTTNELVRFIFYDKMNKFELIQAIGIGAYQHYRGTISDLYQALYNKE